MNSLASELINTRRSEAQIQIILARMICSIISLFFCLLMIIVYIVLCFQVHRNKKRAALSVVSNGKAEYDNNNNNDFNSTAPKKIGIGSHFMFFLIVSNFCGGVIPIIFFVFYKEEKVNNDDGCVALGFLYNIFDLFAVCWTSNIVRLFKASTQVTEFSPGEEKKRFLCGFLYSTICSFLFTVLPFSTGKDSYGDAETHCSFNYRGNFKYVWNTIFSVVVFINLCYNVYGLFMVQRYYSKKLKLLKNNSSEYPVIKIYVSVFRIFPIILVSSRLLKGASRIIEIALEIVNSKSSIEEISNNNAVIIFSFASSILFCLNGFFNSLICFYFFRGVFTKDTLSQAQTSEIPDLRESEQVLIPQQQNQNNSESEEEDEVGDSSYNIED